MRYDNEITGGRENGSTIGNTQAKFEVQRKIHKEVHREGNLKECTEVESKACMEVHMELRRNDRKDGSVNDV